LIIATRLLFSLGDKQSHKASYPPLVSHFELLLPQNHLFLGSLEDAFVLIVPTQFYPLLRSLLLPSLVGLFAMGVGYLALFSSGQGLPSLIRYYGPFAQWIISYGAALTLHLLFFGLVTVWRAIVALLVTVSWALLRYSLWCDAVRKPIRRLLKPLRRLSEEFSSIFSLETLVTIVSLSSTCVCLIMIKFPSVSFASPSTGNEGQQVSDVLLVTSIFYILSSLQLVVIFLWGLSRTSSSTSPLMLPALALAVPAIPLALPSFLFSLSLVMSSLARQSVSLGETFEIFGPELINSTLAIFFIGYTLLYLQR
jgi:hypothetical protein